jgi:hypothetical protein
VGINADVHGWCVQAQRSTAASHALAPHADLAKVQA